MIALPPVPVVTIEQQVRFDYLTDVKSARLNFLKGQRYQEYLKINFLIQANMFVKLATNEFHTIADENYAVQAWKDYNAYLTY